MEAWGASRFRDWLRWLQVMHDPDRHPADAEDDSAAPHLTPELVLAQLGLRLPRLMRVAQGRLGPGNYLRGETELHQRIAEDASRDDTGAMDRIHLGEVSGS